MWNYFWKIKIIFLPEIIVKFRCALYLYAHYTRLTTALHKIKQWMSFTKYMSDPFILIFFDEVCFDTRSMDTLNNRWKNYWTPAINHVCLLPLSYYFIAYDQWMSIDLHRFIWSKTSILSDSEEMFWRLKLVYTSDFRGQFCIKLPPPRERIF